jgi:type IV pilus assembly protein PilO
VARPPKRKEAPVASIDFEKIWQEAQTLDLQNPGAWPVWAQTTAAVLVVVAIIGAGAYVFGKPLQEEFERERAVEQDLRVEFERKQRKVAGLEAYKAQLREMERSFGDMLKQLPSKTEVPSLLNDISQTRVASALEEELFQPEGEIAKDFYAEVPNRIVVVGPYNNIGSFVSSVAGLPRIVTIDNVELKPAGGTAQKGNLRMNAQAKTYRYLDEGEKAPAPAGAPR